MSRKKGSSLGKMKEGHRLWKKLLRNFERGRITGDEYLSRRKVLRKKYPKS